MNARRRIFSIVLAILVLSGLLVISVYSGGARNEGKTTQSDTLIGSTRPTLKLWYNDDALTDFLNDAAVSWNESHTEARVEPTLVTDNEYIRSINDASLDGDDFPDLYIAANNELEKCWKAGLASEVTDTAHFADTSTFPQSAINAVTYEGKILGYPMYYETAAFLINEDYLQQMADDAGQDLDSTVPKTMIDVVKLANAYNAPDGVDDIFAWDVSDILYNYAFLGSYLSIGGETGDDALLDDIVIYNENTIQCLSVYQQLNQFFSIDVTSDTYDSLIDDFADGRSVFTIASTDAPGRIQKKIDTGESELNYLVVPIPDLTDSLTSRTLSITDCLIVNGYSEHESEANDFARWLLFSGMDSFYDRTGLAVCRLDYSYGDSHMDGFTGAYESSIPITKLRTASNFWMELENTFANVWDGTDPNDALYELYSTTMQQMSGTKDYHLQDRITPEAVSISAQLSSGEEEIESTESATTEE